LECPLFPAAFPSVFIRSWRERADRTSLFGFAVVNSWLGLNAPAVGPNARRTQLEGVEAYDWLKNP